MVLPQQLTLTGLILTMDGGSVHLVCIDESGHQHTVKLVQRVNPYRDVTPDWISGRLYFDQELVAIRSDAEAGLLVLLRGALSRESDELNATVIARVVNFVASEEYVRFAKTVEEYPGLVKDPNRYTVWIDCDTEFRNQTIVRLARLEAIGLQAARTRIDSQQPLAENITALEVRGVAAKYLDAGVKVRVEPPFPWALELT